jgi:hypothetical protein
MATLPQLQEVEIEGLEMVSDADLKQLREALRNVRILRGK